MKHYSYARSAWNPLAESVLRIKSALRFGLWVLAILLTSNQLAYANSKGDFKELTNLQELAKTSKQTGLPMMLMFGATYCEFCEELIEQVLEPMVRNGHYDGKVMLMRHVGVDEQDLIPDVNGTLIKKSEWAYHLNADLTPTVLFLDGTGKEVAPRIVGVTNTHLYAGLIHDKLNTAYKNMNNPYRIPMTPDLYEQQLQQTSKQK